MSAHVVEGTEAPVCVSGDDHALAGDVDLVLPVPVVIPWSDDNSSDAALETAMDTVVAAIESDRTLGGDCDDLSCRPYTDIGARTMPNDTVVITFTVPVEVLV